MGTGVLDQLNETIDRAAGLDVDALTDTELDELTVGLQRVRHRLAALNASALARWDGRGVWQSDGSRSAATRLARDGGVSLTTAHIELRRARALVDMPATAAAVGAGRVSMDHVDLLGRADQTHRHDLFLRDEELLVDQCATRRHAQAVRAVEYWTQLADTATGENTPPPAERVSGLHPSTTLHGTVRLDGTLNRIDGTIVSGELNRLEREQHLADQAAGITRSHAERLAAALVEMATRSAADLLVPHLGLADWRRSCSTDPSPSSPHPRHGASPDGCAGRLRCATGTVNTPPAATSPPTSATSTTSCPSASTVRRPSSTAASNAAHTQPRHHQPRPPRHTPPATTRHRMGHPARPTPLAQHPPTRRTKRTRSVIP
jgi:Domain of unknown function (DUF222)